MQNINFYGMTSINEKGQVVIPADARRDQNFKPGDRVVMMSMPHGNAGMMILKAEEVENMLGHMTANMGIVRDQIKQSMDGKEV